MGPLGPGPTVPDRVELQVDYGVRAPRQPGRDPAVVALVIAAGAHLLGIGGWAVARIARARRDERPAWSVSSRRPERLG